ACTIRSTSRSFSTIRTTPSRVSRSPRSPHARSEGCVTWARLLFAVACLAPASGCSEERPQAPEPPVFDVDVAPILQARCVECHGDTNPAGGWSATSFLSSIACVASSSSPATLPADDRAPILKSLDADPHRTLLGEAERATLTAWVVGGTLA